MHAYRYPKHEQQVAALARELGFSQVSVSHEVSPLIKLISRGDTLGIIQSEDIELKNKINSLTKQRNKNNTELKRIEERNNFKLTEGQRLLEKAIILKLIPENTVAKDFSELKQLFQIILEKIEYLIQLPPDNLLKGIDEISIKELDKKIFDLKQERDSLKDDISELELYIYEANKYDNNTQKQINRLKSAYLFSNQSNLFLNNDKCPLC